MLCSSGNRPRLFEAIFDFSSSGRPRDSSKILMVLSIWHEYHQKTNLADEKPNAEVADIIIRFIGGTFTSDLFAEACFPGSRIPSYVDGHPFKATTYPVMGGLIRVRRPPARRASLDVFIVESILTVCSLQSGRHPKISSCSSGGGCANDLLNNSRHSPAFQCTSGRHGRRNLTPILR